MNLINRAIYSVWVLILIVSTTKATDFRPNIIYILTDDLGYGDLGCFGQQKIFTPNIDKMAAEGIIFTDHYAGTSVCAPSRASLMTGKHTGHTSVRHNQPFPQALRPEEITIPEALKDAGYISAVIGKWGVGHQEPIDPMNAIVNGFDYQFGFLNMWHAHNYYPEFLYRNGQKEYLRNVVESQGSKWPESKEGAGNAIVKKDYTHYLFREDLTKFILEHSDTTFFLYLPFTIPHTNGESKILKHEVPGFGFYKDSVGWSDEQKARAAMITTLDSTVGKILLQLKELGIEKNTFVMFTSDNGGEQEINFFKANGIFRGMKREVYEGGIRVPAVAWWPGTIKPGTTTNHVSAFWDMLPTFCDIAGVSVPNGIDGISFLPTLTGIGEQKKHFSLYWEYQASNGLIALRKSDWKIVEKNALKSSPTFELYNIVPDPSEKNNIADKYPEILNELKFMLKISRFEEPTCPFLDKQYIFTKSTECLNGKITIKGEFQDIEQERFEEIGICYSKNENPLISDSVIISNSKTSEFSVSLQNLEEGQMYYFRTFAKYGDIIAYGKPIAETFQTANKITTKVINPLKVYPNPVYNEIFFECSEKTVNSAYVSIFNLSGKQFLEQKIVLKDLRNKINISEIPLGVYFFAFEIEGKKYFQLIKKE